MKMILTNQDDERDREAPWLANFSFLQIIIELWARKLCFLSLDLSFDDIVKVSFLLLYWRAMEVPALRLDVPVG